MDKPGSKGHSQNTGRIKTFLATFIGVTILLVILFSILIHYYDYNSFTIDKNKSTYDGKCDFQGCDKAAKYRLGFNELCEDHARLAARVINIDQKTIPRELKPTFWDLFNPIASLIALIIGLIAAVGVDFYWLKKGKAEK
jgi:hypothetical protein